MNSNKILNVNFSPRIEIYFCHFQVEHMLEKHLQNFSLRCRWPWSWIDQSDCALQADAGSDAAHVVPIHVDQQHRRHLHDAANSRGSHGANRANGETGPWASR